MKKLNLEGEKFGEFVVLGREEAERSPKGASLVYWRCQCSCGEICKVRSAHLRQGKRTHCVKCRYKAITIPNNGGFLNKYFSGYQQAARKRGYSFELALGEFVNIIKTPCFYCGEPPAEITWTSKSKYSDVFLGNGIDRIENQEGYKIENVVPCCKVCNKMKHVLGRDEFLKHVQKIARHQRND